MNWTKLFKVGSAKQGLLVVGLICLCNIICVTCFTSGVSSTFVFRKHTSLNAESQGLIGTKSVGVDYGTVRTGVAISIGYAPRPLEILMDYDGNSTDLATQIVDICARENAQQIVMGLPLDKNGTETNQAMVARQFASVLNRESLRRMGPSFRILLWDERYTSKMALANLKQQSKTGQVSSYELLDAESACIILEDFYNAQGAGAEEVLIDDQVLRDACIQEWQERRQLEKDELDRRNQERQTSLDARQSAMQKVRELEATLGVSLSSKKKKKKSNKSRASGTWQTL